MNPRFKGKMLKRTLNKTLSYDLWTKIVKRSRSEDEIICEVKKEMNGMRNSSMKQCKTCASLID
jgi:hypothetical protein